MNNNPLLIVSAVVIVLLVAVGGILLWDSYQQAPIDPNPPTGTPTSTPTTDGQNGGDDGNSMTLAGGTVSLSYPAEYGLAISQDQLLVRPIIPPCDPGFDYCLYYNDDRYADTNFVSAGLRIERRMDITESQQCLTTQPSGYTGLTPSISSSAEYSLSVFTPIGDAGAGSSATGSLYRLSHEGQCYEFQTRIATSQFANFPAGTVREFTEADRRAMEDSLRSILDSVTLVPSGTEVVFP